MERKKKNHQSNTKILACFLVSYKNQEQGSNCSCEFSALFPRLFFIFLAPLDHFTLTPPGFNPNIKRIIGQRLSNGLYIILKMPLQSAPLDARVGVFLVTIKGWGTQLGRERRLRGKNKRGKERFWWERKKRASA